MQSIAYIPGSNGAGNANQMTVQTLRSPGASDILVNTVTGVPTKFYGSMGAPHTFTDPVTGETITIISEATAVDFAGHIDTGKIVIDAIAPGYVDTRGSLVGDIVVVRPVTEWANNLFNTLSQSHNDDGSIKAAAVTYNPSISDYVQTGGVWSALTGLNATMTALTVWQGGYKGTVATVASRTFTASKDTYVDVLRTLSGYTNTSTLVYTEVANGAAAPALAANSLRLAKVVTSGVAVTSVVQNPFSDGIGNAIRNTGSSSTGSLLIPVKFLVTRASSAVTIANTPTVLVYDGKIFDTSNSYSTVSGVFTAPVAGYYDFNAAIVLTAAVSRLFLSFYKNGNEYSRGADFQSPTGSVQNSTFMQLDAGDMVTARYYVGGGVGISNTILTQFSGKLVSVA